MGTSASTQSHHNAKYLKVNIRYCKFTHRKLLLNYQAFVCPKHLHFVLATGTSYTYRLLGLLYRKVYLVYTDGLHGKQHKKKHAHTHIKKKNREGIKNPPRFAASLNTQPARHPALNMHIDRFESCRFGSL